MGHFTPAGFCLAGAPTAAVDADAGDAADEKQCQHHEDRAVKDAIVTQVAAFLQHGVFDDEGEDESKDGGALGIKANHKPLLL